MSGTILNKMSHMKLLGMLRSYQSMLSNRIHDGLTHDEVVDTLIQAEWEDRENKKINRHLRRARFRSQVENRQLDCRSDLVYGHWKRESKDLSRR